MQTTQLTNNILDENFEMPVCTCDLMEVIENAFIYYESMPMQRSLTRSFKFKLNEIIGEYNDRRGMKIYNPVH